VADRISKPARSRNMAAIKSVNMKPEMIVRSIAHRLGYRYRLHARDLPGKPDLVFRLRKKAIFVHGCFWHQHKSPKCLDGRAPKSNLGYWIPKLTRNVERDERSLKTLKSLGWKTLVLWECEVLRAPKQIEQKLKLFLR
jgi:DNA mismatch endonuclease, patch repair protein